MIQILAVEDDDDKLRKIQEIVDSALVDDEYHMATASTVFDAAQLLKQTQYDLLILDVRVPMRKGEDPRMDGGTELLQQVSARSEYNVPAYVVGLTAYEESVKELAQVFEQFTWTLILYDASANEWERRLTNCAQHVARVKRGERNANYETDIAIVTALDRRELEQVLQLDAGWDRLELEGDTSTYYSGQFRRGEASVSVVAAAALQMGMPAATGLAMKMCAQFKPRYLAMTGIAAGVKGDLGDILVADRTWDYGSGKSKATEEDSARGAPSWLFEPAPTAIPLAASVLEKIRVFSRNDEVLKRIEIGWAGTRPGTPLAVHIGPVASGAAVLENRHVIEAIQSHDRKLIGVEMEMYGIFLAARICPAPNPTALAIKSICDFGDGDKSDDFQDYAAYTSAQFLYEFALCELC